MGGGRSAGNNGMDFPCPMLKGKSVAPGNGKFGSLFLIMRILLRFLEKYPP
jgi:hypothetical protein